MSDRKALAREIAARTKPRFIEIKPEPRRKVSRPSSRRFVEIARQRRSGVPFTEDELTPSVVAPWRGRGFRDSAMAG